VENDETASPLVPEEPTEEKARQASFSVATVLGVVAVVAFFALLGLLAYRIYPATRPRQPDPSFVDIVFANNLVVFAARAILFSAAVVLAVTALYIVYSMSKSMQAGQPLEQFGPLRVRAVQDLSEELQQWQNWWSEADAENTDLRARLERADVILADLLEENELLKQQLNGVSEDEENAE
jgi:hypothetical protein